MKRLLLALTLCLAFSSNLYAKKSEIKWEISGDLSVTVSDSTCEYNAESIFRAETHAHRTMEIHLDVLVGVENEIIYSETIYAREFSENQDFGPRVGPHFFVPMGMDWTLAWVLVSTRGKGRVVDAIDTLSGTCTSP